MLFNADQICKFCRLISLHLLLLFNLLLKLLWAQHRMDGSLVGLWRHTVAVLCLLRMQFEHRLVRKKVFNM